MNTSNLALSATARACESANGNSYSELQLSNGLILAASIVTLGSRRYGAVSVFRNDQQDALVQEPIELIEVTTSLTSAQDLLTNAQQEAVQSWTAAINRLCFGTGTPWILATELTDAIFGA